MQSKCSTIKFYFAKIKIKRFVSSLATTRWLSARSNNNTKKIEKKKNVKPLNVENHVEHIYFTFFDRNFVDDSRHGSRMLLLLSLLLPLMCWTLNCVRNTSSQCLVPIWCEPCRFSTDMRFGAMVYGRNKCPEPKTHSSEIHKQRYTRSSTRHTFPSLCHSASLFHPKKWKKGRKKKLNEKGKRKSGNKNCQQQNLTHKIYKNRFETCGREREMCSRCGKNEWLSALGPIRMHCPSRCENEIHAHTRIHISHRK